MEPEDLHRTEAPTVTLRIQPAEARRHNASAETSRDVQARPAGFEHRSEASVSSLMHHSFQPPTSSSALRRKRPIVPTNGTVLRSFRDDMTAR